MKKKPLFLDCLNQIIIKFIHSYEYLMLMNLIRIMNFNYISQISKNIFYPYFYII